jgi:hypothetical protein
MTKPKVALYLAGSIKKGHEKDDESFWNEEHRHILKQALSPYDLSFLNPAHRLDDLTDQYSVFGRDMLQVFCSDLVLVDARDRRGLGVGAEMMWAKFNAIPVVTWAPKESHYHKSYTTVLDIPVKDFVHPFVASLSDAIVETLLDGANWIKNWKENPSLSIKGVEHVQSAMRYYKEQQLNQDLPMKDLLYSSSELQERLQNLVLLKDIRQGKEYANSYL